METLDSDFLKKIHLFLFSVYYECFACISMCPFGAHEGKKRVLNSLELFVGRHLMGAGTQTWLLCKAIKHPNHCAFFPAFGIGLKNYFCILCAHFVV